MVPTIEFEISYGSIDDAKFMGLNHHFSSKSTDIYRQFSALNMNKSYVFRYEKPYWANPVWNSTHYLITAIEELKKPDQNLPRRIQGNPDRVGTYNPDAKRNGVVVEVERWGFMDVTCTLTVHMGGSTAGKVLPFVNMVIYGERNCAAAEKLVEYGVEVAVQYSQDYIEIYDGSRRIVKSIDVLETASEIPGRPAARSLSELEQQLLNNPVFLKELKRKLAEADRQQIQK